MRHFLEKAVFFIENANLIIEADMRLHKFIVNHRMEANEENDDTQFHTDFQYFLDSEKSDDAFPL